MIRDFGEPNGNADFLASKFRDELMPSRGRLHRQKSPLVKVNRVSSSSVCLVTCAAAYAQAQFKRTQRDMHSSKELCDSLAGTHYLTVALSCV